MTTITIITTLDYRSIFVDSRESEATIQSAINYTFLRLDALCSNQISERWERTIGQYGYLDDNKKEYVKQAFIQQTRYFITSGSNFSQGSYASSLGSYSTNTTIPKKDDIAPGVRELLQKAGLYNNQQFQSNFYSTRKINTWESEIDPTLTNPITEAVGDLRYVKTKQDKAFKNKVLSVNSNGDTIWAEVPTEQSFEEIQAQVETNKTNITKNEKAIDDLGVVVDTSVETIDNNINELINRATQHETDIERLENRYLVLLYVGVENPTAEQINDFAESQGYTTDTKKETIGIDVKTTNKTWWYYKAQGWVEFNSEVATATNTSLGVVRGNATDNSLLQVNSLGEIKAPTNVDRYIKSFTVEVTNALNGTSTTEIGNLIVTTDKQWFSDIFNNNGVSKTEHYLRVSSPDMIYAAENLQITRESSPTITFKNNETNVLRCNSFRVDYYNYDWYGNEIGFSQNYLYDRRGFSINTDQEKIWVYFPAKVNTGTTRTPKTYTLTFEIWKKAEV